MVETGSHCIKLMPDRRSSLKRRYRLQRQTRTLRWLWFLLWPLPELPRKLAIELELRRCERQWR